MRASEKAVLRSRPVVFHSGVKNGQRLEVITAELREVGSFLTKGILPIFALGLNLYTEGNAISP